jgi:transcriptional regulator with PAS, ATPase and Fis domain
MPRRDLSSVTGSIYADYERRGEEGLPVGGISPAAQTIYSRDAETHTLHKTYQCLLAAKRAPFVVIHGESGAGKTALVSREWDCSLRQNVIFSER